ncbi:MAG: hypothetical protein Q9221_007301 [Calogaya cf. arnoldii]
MNLPPPIHNTSSEEDEDDMTAAMGFSTFGTQHPAHPSKRTKYKHNADGGEHNATGGNMLPLGFSRARQKTESTEDTIRVNERDGREVMGESEGRKEEEVEGADVNEVAARVPDRCHLDEGKDQMKNNDDDDESSTLLQRQTLLLKRINEGGVPSSDSKSYKPTDPVPNANTMITQQRKNTESTRVDLYSTMQLKRRPGVEAKDGFEGHTWNEWRKGVRDERGDTAFYDASFVEDPWRGLKAKAGG